MIMSSYNGTILAIDATHIRINKPVLNRIKYFNRKKYYSLNVLMLTYHNKKNRFITNGYGQNHDIKGYRKYENLQNYVKNCQIMFG